jgi:Na+/proline symporter/nitrogen-specific signal transduction histidine kinase
MLSTPLVLAASFAYLLLLFGIAHYADGRGRQGRSLINNPWVYALSIGVYCTAWTYYGSVGRAASSGLWFLPIYLGPTLGMLLAWTVLRKMIRIARRDRITSIADFIASRYGKSRALAALVTLIALVGILPYVALQLKAIASGLALLTGSPGTAGPWWQDSTLYIALLLAGFTIAFGARHLDSSERHEGMVAAIAFESLVKLLAFVAVGVFVCWGMFAGPGEIFTRAADRTDLAPLLGLGGGEHFAAAQWFALTLLAMLSVFLLPRQFQMLVVENTDERHLKRLSWAFPLYLLLINLFVLPIALGGLLHFGSGRANAETFVLSLPLALDSPGLALLAFIGGLSAATGMIIVEAIAVATMVSNDLAMPLLLRAQRGSPRDVSALPLAVRRTVIVALLLLGYLYFRVAGEAYALVSIGLISFAAVAQFAPALFGGMYWKGGTRAGALAGLAAGFALWAWTLLLPSIAKSGWLPAAFLAHGPFGIALLRPEQLFGLAGFDNLTHALLWSLLANAGLYVAVSLARAPTGREAAQALRFVDAMHDAGHDVGHDSGARPVAWRGAGGSEELRALAARFLGVDSARRLLADFARRRGGSPAAPDAELVNQLETQLAGAIGSASARAAVASVVEEETLAPDDVLRMLDETSEVRALNRQLASLDRLKDDFMSSVTHELRTPLTSIRAFAELMRDDPQMDPAQRQHFVDLIVAESERLSRLVNQVLDMAKIESGHAEWRNETIDLAALVAHAVETTAAGFQARGITVTVEAPAQVPALHADRDRILQVLLNLLSNAAKFAPQDGGRVTVRLQADAREARIEVRDNGPGVPPEQQRLVFEKFRQGGDARARPQGTGLGLPISRQIVEHYGGRMWLHSTPGEGACFGFALPWHAEETKP